MKSLFGFCAIVALFLCPSLALAGTVDLSPVTNYAFDILGTIITGAVTAALAYLARKFKIDADLTSQAHYIAVLENGIETAIAYAKTKTAGKADIDVKNSIVTIAANYLIPKIPTALAKLGITEKGLGERILARLNLD